MPARIPARIPALGLVLLLGLAAPVAAFDLTAMTDAEQAAFGAEVRAYLLANPEVLIEAINTLEARQAAEQVSADGALVQAHLAAIFQDGVSWVGGNPDGDVTLVEFMDYRCGYCRKAFTEVEDLVKADGNIRFVLKEFPILGEQSDLASRFAVAVQQVAGADAYKAAHDALMGLRSDVTPEALQALAAHLGLDAPAVMARMASAEVTAVIEANHALANILQISGTPTFVVADQMVRGYVPLAQMQEMIAAIRAE